MNQWRPKIATSTWRSSLHARSVVVYVSSIALTLFSYWLGRRRVLVDVRHAVVFVMQSEGLRPDLVASLADKVTARLR